MKDAKSQPRGSASHQRHTHSLTGIFTKCIPLPPRTQETARGHATLPVDVCMYTVHGGSKEDISYLLPGMSCTHLHYNYCHGSQFSYPPPPPPQTQSGLKSEHRQDAHKGRSIKQSFSRHRFTVRVCGYTSFECIRHAFYIRAAKLLGEQAIWLRSLKSLSLSLSS